MTSNGQQAYKAVDQTVDRATALPTVHDIQGVEDEAFELSKPLLDHSLANDRIDAEAPHRKRYDGVFRSASFVAGGAGILCALLLLFLGLSSFHASAAEMTTDILQYGSIVQIGPYWHNFSYIHTWFPFGDSYTTMYFDVTGQQPTIENPLGNPLLPDLALSSGFGVTYVAYLAARYNHSYIETYNLAVAGGTIDNDINLSYVLWGDFVNNVDRFLSHYCTNNTGIPTPSMWQPDRTLFSVFYGINDLVGFNRSHPRIAESFQSYDRSLDRLYSAGARNFVIFNLPPLDRTPSRYEAVREISAEANEVQMYNDGIAQSIERLKNSYTDATIFSLDIHGLVERMADTPSSFATTQVYKNTRDWCSLWGRLFFLDKPTADQVGRCRGLLPIQYLWHDLVHLTWPAHEVFAQALAALLISTSDN